MVSHKANYQAINLPAGTYDSAAIGDGKTSPTIHQLYCLTAGNVTIQALGGGEFTWPATAGQSINVLCGHLVVNSGTFVGFKTMNDMAGRFSNTVING